MQEKLLRAYAHFMVGTAVNLQKGQTLLLNSPIETAGFARLCAEEAYACGARDVVVHYNDEEFSRIRMREAALPALEDVKPWKLRSLLDYAEGEGGAAVLSIYAKNPEIYKGLDTAKIDKAGLAAEKAMKPWQEMVMSNRVQWSIASVPTAAWAARVFPGKSAEEAEEALWQAIFRVCRVGEGQSPEQAWALHAQQAARRIETLHAMDLDALHLKSENGTDLTVGLAEGFQFAGVCENSVDGVPFFANVPSEEIFTAPHSHRVHGTVKSSLPYVYNGNLIEGITLRFEEGRAVEFSAERGEELLAQMMDADEGARRLGEIALVPASSPVRQTGLLFFNTLFDENAACHIAFGQGYPSTLRGGTEMDEATLQAQGLNGSLIHEDIMVGTADMEIVGIAKNGEKKTIFSGGEWVF